MCAGASEEEKLSNAKYCINVARKVGVCVFLTPEDIVEVGECEGGSRVCGRQARVVGSGE